MRDNFLTDISPLLSLPVLFNVDVRLNYLDINPGSDDRIVIDTLSINSTVDFDPQKSGMMDLGEWADSYGLHPQLDDPGEQLHRPRQ